MARRNKGFSVERVYAPFGEEINTFKKSRRITALDLVVLLLNVIKGEKTSTVGFEDANRTFKELVGTLGHKKKIMVADSLIESALWSCNLLDEQDKFEHPLGHKFTPWMKALLEPDGFDRMYNFIKNKEKK